MRTAIYLRQSLDREGSGLAVARQEQACRELAAARGWDVVEVFTDNDVSASTRKPRPAYSRMIAAVRSGDLDALVAWHVDRLTRQPRELEDLVYLVEDYGVRIATCSGDLDFSNATGRMLARLLGSIARAEAERKGERHKAAHRQRAQAGLPMPGVRAFGYAADGITPLEPEASAVRAAFAAVEDGSESLAGICRKWNAAGHLTHRGHAWTTNSLRAVLRSPRYAGLCALSRDVPSELKNADGSPANPDAMGRPRRRRVLEVVGPAAWPALVTEARWRAVGAILDDPDRRTADTSLRRYLLPGIALCDACGLPVSTGWRHVPGKRHPDGTRDKVLRRQYVCLKARGGCGMTKNAEHVEALVVEVMVARLSMPDAVVPVTTPDLADPVTAGAVAAVEALEARLRDVAAAIASGALDVEVGAESSRLIRAELEQLARDAVPASTVAVPVVTGVEDWEALPLDVRRDLVAAFLSVRLRRVPPSPAFDPDGVDLAWVGAA